MTVLPPPTTEDVAVLTSDALHIYGWDLSADGNVVKIGIGPFGDGDKPLLPEIHFRAVVVEGDEAPIVMKWPAELGLSWHDGGDLLAFDHGIIRLSPRGVDEWELSPGEALDLAAQLAAMAAIAARADDTEGIAFGGTRLPETAEQSGGVA